MESKFPERVRLERMALDAVNDSGVFSEELVGMGMDCIGAWIARTNSIDLYSGRIDGLFDALVDVSYACHAEADISDEIFHDVDPAVAAHAIEHLIKVISKLKSELL